MTQVGSDPDLLVEPISAKSSRQFWTENLDGYLALMFQVASEVYRGHTTTADLPLDSVAVGQCGFQAVQVSRHAQQLQGL